MNPKPQILNPELPAPRPEPPSPFAYRGNGKVARLPKPLRDKICAWMLDCISYPDIIERLGTDGKDLNPGHLCEWRKRGYQDWLLEQAWLARTRARQEPAADLSANFDATLVGHAALQLGTLHIFEALRDLPSSSSPESSSSSFSSSAPESSSSSSSSHSTGEVSAMSPDLTKPAGDASPPPPLKERAGDRRPDSRSDAPRRSALDLRLGGDSAAFVRLMNALARASRETMLLQKYREACAKAREALLPLKDLKRKLTDSERLAIVRNVDEIFGIDPEGDYEASLVPEQVARPCASNDHEESLPLQ